MSHQNESLDTVHGTLALRRLLLKKWVLHSRGVQGWLIILHCWLRDRKCKVKLRTTENKQRAILHIWVEPKGSSQKQLQEFRKQAESEMFFSSQDRWVPGKFTWKKKKIPSFRLDFSRNYVSDLTTWKQANIPLWLTVPAEKAKIGWWTTSDKFTRSGEGAHS